MLHVRSRLYAAAAVMFLISGCGDEDPVEQFLTDTAPLDLHDPALVKQAARFSDPSVLVAAATMPAELALHLFRDEEEPSGPNDCPRLINESDREAGIVNWRIEANCGWARGRIVARGDTNSTTIQYHQYRQGGESSVCEGEASGMEVSGAVTVPYAIFPWTYADHDELPPEPPDHGKGHYEIHVLFEQRAVNEEERDHCQAQRITVAYDVTLDQRIEPPYGLGWKGTSDIQGRAAAREETRMSPDAPWQPSSLPPSAWRLSAEDYGIIERDDTCEGDFVGGTLHLESGDDVAILHPDAITSCFEGPDGTAEYAACTRWSLNGEEQAEEMCGFVWLMDGVSCSAGPDAPPPLAAIAIMLAGLLWLGRRHRRAA